MEKITNSKLNSGLEIIDDHYFVLVINRTKKIN